MLGTRVVTAVVLLALLAGALTLARPLGLPLLTLLIVAAAVWEWLRLLKVPGWLSIHIAVATIVVLWFVDGALPHAPRLFDAYMAITTFIWVALAVALVTQRHFPGVGACRACYITGAIFLPGACWLALMDAYRQGAAFLLSVLAVVWGADIAAYFVGRAFGRRKLAPAISPGKTVEGALGALIAVWLMAAVCVGFAGEDTLFARLAALGGGVWLLPLTALLVALSIVGDLFESHLKRHAGVKDSSGLLPGHGGVLDRIDALLPVVPAAVAMCRVW